MVENPVAVTQALEAWAFNVHLECLGSRDEKIEMVMGGAVLDLRDLDKILESATEAPTVAGMEEGDLSPAWQQQARVLLNMHGTDPAQWSGEEVRRVFDLISAVAYAQLPQDVIRLVVAARMVAWEDPDPANIKELQSASEAFASSVPWEDEPEDAA